MAEDVDAQLAAVGAVLVEDRALRRLIKRHRGLSGIGLQVPHAEHYAIPREALAKLEPALAAIPGLPDHVVAIRGDRAALASGSAEAWSAAWRACFHGHVHAAFESRAGTNDLLTPAAIRDRVHRIGQTEFDEIRVVLRQEDALLPPDDDLSTYIEFVALYLELKHFAPRAIARVFPTLSHAKHVDAAIALDIDDPALLAASRPAAAPSAPIIESAPTAVRTRTPLRRIREAGARPAAASARTKGNHARAAILASRAGDDDAARADLDLLHTQLAAALGVPATAAAGWTDALLPVARFAASQRVIRFTAGARLLHDLQSAVVDASREDRVVDTVTWALSLGKQPIIRALPATREIRIAKHLHAANKKIAEAGLVTSEEREQLASAVHDMVEHADQQVRRVLRPKLEAALDEVDLRANNLPERVAQKKLVDELLDQAVAVGRLSLPNLRDALSHNELKMEDLRLAQLARGDQLLRADKILSTTLDGVYRRGEIYLRGLQKLSSILFGTWIGRALSLYFLLPVLGSFTALEGLQHVVGPLCHKAFGVHPEIATPPAFIGVAIFLFLVLHVGPFRHGTLVALRVVGRGLRAVLIDAPFAFWRLPVMRSLADSLPSRFLIKPAILPLFLAWWLDDPYRWPIAIGVFILDELIVNTRTGHLVREWVADEAVVSGRHVARRIAPGVVRLIIDVFAKLMELLDRGLYRVDEWLRFRAGQSRVKIVAKGVLGVAWFFVTYFLRLYVNLFVEPVINPVKHFPTVTVAAKLTLPFSPGLIKGMTPPLASILGPTLGGGFAAFTVFVIPGIAGFLVWELKENWKLYRATRPETLRAVGFGHHGETMARMLRPGFHSGTIPKLYGKLRHAARKGDERAVAKQREALHHVEEAVWKLAERELVALLEESPAFHARDMSIAHVALASNRVHIQLAAPSLGADLATLAIEEQSGWLIASLPVRGWIAALPPDQLAILELALAGFYKLAAVAVVREQLEDALRGEGPRAPAYDIAADGLVVWPGPGYLTEVVYDLKSRTLAPTVRGEPAGDAPLPALAGKRAVFANEPLRWDAWTTAWQLAAAGGAPTRLVAGPSLVATPLAPASDHPLR